MTTETLIGTLVELNIVLLVLLGLALFIFIRGKRRDTAALAELVKTVKENEPEQLEALRKEFKEKYQQDDANAEENAKKLLKIKKGFYKRFINIYMYKRSKEFSEFDQQLDELIMSYRAMMPVDNSDDVAQQTSADTEDSAQTSAGALEEKTDNLSADVNELKKQNEALQNQLEETKNALDATINEYVSAYSGGAEEGKAKLEAEMEKLKEENKKGILEEEEEAETQQEGGDEDTSEISESDGQDADRPESGDSPDEEITLSADDGTDADQQAADTPSSELDEMTQAAGDVDDSEGVMALSDILEDDEDTSSDDGADSKPRDN